MDSIKEFLKLPSSIIFEGVTFELQIVKEGNEASLVYDISTVSALSKHYDTVMQASCWLNPFLGGFKGFLCLEGGIVDDLDFEVAVKEIQKFLKTNNLV